MNSREYRELQEAYFGVYEIDEAMMDGPRKTAMAAKQHSPYATSRDRATAFNVGVRDDRPRDKKSTGGKGERYSDFGDRGAGNASRRRRGLQPLRGDAKPTQAEQVDLYDIILSHLLDEGYADSLEAAEGIMVSMSEEWREEILDESIGSSVAKLPGEIAKIMNRKPRPRKVPVPNVDREKLQQDRAAMAAFAKK
jgi:hypothetical protein